MRQSILAAVVLGSVSLVQAVNDFETIFSTYKKGDSEEIKWKDFGNTDITKLSVVSVVSKSPISIILPNCAEPVKVGTSCTRFTNTGKFKFESGTSILSLLSSGASYYFQIEYIEHAPSTKTGVSKSSNFAIESTSSSSSGSSSKSSSSKSTKKGKGKGKLGQGGIIGVAVGVALLFAVLVWWAIAACLAKRKNKNSGTNTKGVDGDEDHEMGKTAQDPLMGQDGRMKDTTVWSADVPDDHSRPGEAGLSKYEPYKATTTGQGAAAEYYNEPVKPSANGAGPMGNDRY